MRWSALSRPHRLDEFKASLPWDKVHSSVLTWSKTRSEKEVWAVAFSGGADSLALLLMLWAHWPERRSRIVALHFNHRLRGRASTADEAFCRRVCEGIGIRLRVGKWKKSRPGASEAEARTARFEFFAQATLTLKAKALWFGHQQDDIAETMLMRLARGSGTAGLAAPRPLNKFGGSLLHVRPLLTFQKAEIKQWLKKAGIPWREDSTNQEDDFFRNRVRLSVVPAWRRAAGDRDALLGAALSRDLIEEDDRALESWLDEIWSFDEKTGLDLSPLRDKPTALVRRALHRWLLLKSKSGVLSRQGFGALLAALEQGKATRQSLGIEGFAVIKKQRLVFQAVRPISL